jgi:hypothetical protein
MIQSAAGKSFVLWRWVRLVAFVILVFQRKWQGSVR